MKPLAAVVKFRLQLPGREWREIVSIRAVAAAALIASATACASTVESADVLAPGAPDKLPSFVIVQPELNPSATLEEVAAGEFLFANMCAKCHGGARQNAGRIAISRSDYAGIKEVIARGTIVYGGNMPAWTDILSSDQIDAVTKYILASRQD